MKKILSGVSIFLLVLCQLVGTVSAATIELPQTGQTKCYSGAGVEISCAGTGQDGATQAGAALPVPRFTTDYYDMTVQDNLTGLMWTLDSRTPDDPPYVCADPERNVLSLQEALTYISCLNTNNFLGYNNWRLPNRWELRSLINDLSQTDPALPANYPFINAENFGDGYIYWSSTHCEQYLPDVWDTAQAWAIHIWTGSEGCGTVSPYTFAWPVRSTTISLPKTGQTTSYYAGDDGAIEAGIAWPSPRFTVTHCTDTGPCSPDPATDCDGDPLNDVVTDNLTGLIWVRTPDNIHRTWDEALTYSNGLNLCGYTNWRLPNINELGSLWNAGEPDTAVWLNNLPNEPVFLDVESFYHWSSTTDRFNRQNALRVDMWDGSIDDYSKELGYFYAWPVRLPGALLTVSKTGGGSGIVTSEPPGIDCGSDCSEVFLEGTEVTLTATADEGSTFEGWSGACTGTGTCIITINTDTQVSARFSAPSSDCTYSISPASKTFSIKGKTFPVKVAASGGSNCPEPVTTISQGSNWISANVTSWQANKGVVTVTVSPSNTSVQRIGTVSIGNRTFTATQKAKKCTRPIFTPSSETWPIAGGTGSFLISFSEKSAPDCLWSAQSDADTPWVFTNSAGSGNGTVDYSVSPNLSGDPRKGKIEVTLVQNPKRQYKFKISQLD